MSTPANRTEPPRLAAPPTTPAGPATPSRTVASTVVALVLVILGGGTLGLAAWMEPAREGFGTHQSLGLPPCGFQTAVGLPCATCGMTTAFAHAAEGDLVSSFLTQPAGALLAVLTAVFVILGAWSLLTGNSLAPLGWRLWRPGTILIGGTVVLIAWGYKIAVMSGTVQ